jgi:hypothetical protein
LPQNVTDAAVRQGISAVVDLSQRLALKRDAIKRAPGLKALAEQIRTDFGSREPTITWSPRHCFTVHFTYWFDAMPAMNQLPVIAQAVIAGLAQLEPRCMPATDVFIFFSRFGQDVATWQGGQFIVIPTPNPGAAG